MFGDVAIVLLKKMGMSGHPTGAIKADEIPAAMQKLRGALAGSDDPAAGAEGDDGEPAVGLNQRAFPLIEFMERSAAGGADVMWDHT